MNELESRVVQFKKEVSGLKRTLETGGQPPYDGGMEARLTKLETRLETILPTLATRGDVSEAKADIIKWGATIAFAATAIILSVLLSVLLFAINRIALPTTQQATPVVIYAQPIPAPPPPAAPKPR